jgi:hypothetical protein
VIHRLISDVSVAVTAIRRRDEDIRGHRLEEVPMGVAGTPMVLRLQEVERVAAGQMNLNEGPITAVRASRQTVRFPEEFRAPAGVRKSGRPEPASPKYRPMGILSWTGLAVGHHGRSWRELRCGLSNFPVSVMRLPRCLKARSRQVSRMTCIRVAASVRISVIRSRRASSE